ncbi:MAG: hypothetical protein ACXAD7_24895, partial [Candidatus Kariarchaeaceae archaeon]|jgi:hypothetical protein
VAEFTYAIGMASISGSNTALLWDSYNDENLAKKFITNGRMIQMASAVILMVIGGILPQYNVYLPFYISAAGSMINVFLYLKTLEPGRKKLDAVDDAWRQSMILIRDVRFIDVLMISVILFVSLRVVFWAYIPKLQNYKVNPIWFGIVLAGANAVAVFSTLYLRKRPDISSLEVIILSLVGCISCFIFVIDNSLLLMLFAICGHQVVRGILGIYASIRVNEISSSEIRASAESLRSSIGSACYLILTWILNEFQSSLMQSMTINAVLSFVILLYLFFRYFNMYHNRYSINKPVSLT